MKPLSLERVLLAVINMEEGQDSTQPTFSQKAVC